MRRELRIIEAEEYVYDIIDNGIKGSLPRGAIRLGVNIETVRSRVRRARERGEFPPSIRVPTFAAEDALNAMTTWMAQPIGHVQMGTVPTTRIYFANHAVTQDELERTVATSISGLWATLEADTP